MTESPPLPYPDPDVYVRLRLIGDFDPVEVTRRLGIAPSYSHERNSLVGNGWSGRRHPDAGWFLSSEDDVTSSEIDPHLEWLLERIELRAAMLGEILSRGTHGDVDCFWSSVGASGGPWLEPQTMTRLGALHLPLVISFYAVDFETVCAALPPVGSG